MKAIEAYLVSVGHAFIKENTEKKSMTQLEFPAETSWEVFLISKFDGVCRRQIKNNQKE